MNHSSIVFYCGTTQFTNWDPDNLNITEDAFIGGSEEAVIYLSEELVKLGWKVKVFAYPKKEGNYNGVEWLDYHNFDGKENYDILVYWRSPEMVNLNVSANKTYLWCHDVQTLDKFPTKTLQKLTKIIVLSNAHRMNLPNIEDSKLFISSNGILEHSPEIKPYNNPNWCIWTSSYDRGLEYLLTIWPEVKKEVPEAQLHVFYGWQIFDQLYANDPNALGWRRHVNKLLQQSGVTDHGRISQTEMELWYKKCGIFSYPSNYFEISCISAMKAQAFGAIPVVTNLAALNETVKFGKKIKGDINKPEVLEEYKKELIHALKNRSWQEKERKKMISWAKNEYSWKKVAKQWTEEFKKKEENLIIQPFSSRFDTPRVQISKEAYENSGIGIFSSERIPFAERTSPAFAQNLIDLLVVRVNRLKKIKKNFKEKIHIYELGAGSGILAKRILYLLKNQHPDLYNKIILHLSDSSKPTVSELKLSEISKNHRRHVVFEVIDATKPKFTHKPFLIYFTNLIDAIPEHRYIQIHKGKIFEARIQTYLNKDVQIIDAAVFPPKILGAKEIAKILTSGNVNKRLALAPQILSVLQEDIYLLPIEDVGNIGKEELQDLKELADFRKDGTVAPFNYSFTVRKILREIFQELEHGGFLFFSDTGITSADFEQDLLMKYGVVIAFAVDFPSLLQTAKGLGTTYLTSNMQGHPQEMLVDTLPEDKGTESLFKKIPSEGLQGEVNTFLENTKKILAKNSDDKRQNFKKIEGFYSILTKDSQINYQLLNDLAFFLIQADFFKEANLYADILYKNYSHASGVYYYIVKGIVRQNLGDFNKAEDYFQKAIGNKEGFIAYAYMGGLYWQQKKYKEYIKVIKEYLKHTRKNDYLKCLFFIASAKERLFDQKGAKKTLEELIKLGQKLKNMTEAEKDFLKQAHQLLGRVS